MSRLRGAHLPPLLVSSLLGWSCAGSIGDAGGEAHDDNAPGARTGGSGGGDDDTPQGDPQLRDWFGSGNADAVARLPLRVLTRAEYDNTIDLIFADSYGVTPANLKPGAGLPGETLDLSGFLSVGELSEQHVLRHLEAASALTSAIGGALPRLLGCDLAKGAEDETCVRAFLPGFGELLYRRPLTPAEIDAHLEFYRGEREDLGQTAAAAALALIEAMLQSPHFLYRWERGFEVAAREGEVVRLNPFQTASRLSFFLWASGPDRELLALAKSGGLDTAEDVAAQARKMLRSPRAARALDSFHAQWLGLAGLDSTFKDDKRFPDWNPALGTAMRQEIETFARHVVLEGDGKLESLLSAPYTFANAALARVYGVSDVQGSELRKIDLDPASRAGLLTMPGLLALSSEASVPNPFRRGKLVLEKILCRHLEPPADIPMPPKIAADDPRSERQILEELTAAPACDGCHRQINPLGFALSRFDAIGQLRDKDEAGKSIDASGAIPDSDVSFAGPTELAAALGRADEARACLTKQWFRFALARHEEDEDAHALIAAFAAFGDGDHDLRELLVGFVTTRAFLFRTLEAGETVEVLP